MQIRRPVAALVTALALVGGGASLTGCASPTDAKTGTPADNAVNTSGNKPQSVDQGSLPDNSDRETTTGADRAGGNGKGEP
jgi:hypothetical protein